MEPRDPASALRRRTLIVIGLVALGLRLLAWAALSGPEKTQARGYTYYLEMADALAEGRGFVRTMPFGQGERRAIRTPGYPLAVAALSALPVPRGTAIAVFGATCGALTAVLAALLAARVFSRGAGQWAGLLVAAWPPAVVHDTALQDTALYTLGLTAAALLAWTLASRQEARAPLGGAALLGLVAAAAVLVRAPLLPTMIALCAWPLSGAGPLARRARIAAVALAALAVGLAPWLARNARVLGRPVLTSDAGRSLWLGNHEGLFETYPEQSIDRAEERAWTSLPESTRASVRALGADELAQDAWFRDRALAFLREHPAEALRGAALKAWATFSPWQNPRGSDLKQAVHAPCVGALWILALAGAWLGRRESVTGLVLACAVLLALQSAVFFGHSGYRAAIDPLLLVLAARAAAAVAGTAGSVRRTLFA